MKTNEFIKWLKKQGCEIVANRPKGGHVTVIYKDRKTVMPTHGARHELRKGTCEAIKKQLGLK